MNLDLREVEAGRPASTFLISDSGRGSYRLNEGTLKKECVQRSGSWHKGYINIITSICR